MSAIDSNLLKRGLPLFTFFILLGLLSGCGGAKTVIKTPVPNASGAPGDEEEGSAGKTNSSPNPGNSVQPKTNLIQSPLSSPENRPVMVPANCKPFVVTDTKGLQAFEVEGGRTGLFVRETTCTGFNAIKSTLTLPYYHSSASHGEEPWVYYGFKDGSTDIEAGFSYQRGDSSTNPRWIPYLRKGGKFDYSYEGVPTGSTVNVMAVYNPSASRLELYVDGALVKSIAVHYDEAQLRIRRMTTIAVRDNDFNGVTPAVNTLSNVVWRNTMLSPDHGANFPVPFDRAPLTALKLNDGPWVGSIYWPSDKVRYERSIESNVQVISILGENQ